LEGEKFGDVMEDILMRIAEQLLETLIIQKTVAAISSGLQNNAGFAGVSGGKAGGGTVSKSGNYMVGESGPEIMTLPKGTAITPNKDIGGGDSVVNIQVINNGNDQVETATETKPDGSQLIKFIINTVANDIGNGGGTARAMQQQFGSRVQPITR